jgi:hypothetical protein
MAVPVSSFQNFMDKFEERKHAADLFAFLLFDDRPSHQAVETFADAEFEWLDGLAAAARIFFFIFLRKDEYEGVVYNPGLEVANMFGIRPNQLPGIILFTLSDDDDIVKDGVYLPLDTRIFADDIDHVEEVISDLFSIIQECRAESESAAELLENIRKEVRRLHQKGQLRPFVNYLRETAMSVANFPRGFMGNLESALAGEVSRRLVGG